VINITGDRRRWGTAAEAFLITGIIGALGAVVAGLRDWQDTDPPARRIGLTRGLLNIAGDVLFTGSVRARKRKSRGLGRCLSASCHAHFAELDHATEAWASIREAAERAHSRCCTARMTRSTKTLSA
jgi:hypothetical protein